MRPAMFTGPIERHLRPGSGAAWGGRGSERRRKPPGRRGRRGRGGGKCAWVVRCERVDVIEDARRRRLLPAAAAPRRAGGDPPEAVRRERYGCVRFTTVTVSDDGYCAEWCTTLCATTPFASSQFFPPVLRLRSNRGKLLLETSMRRR